MGLKSFAAVSMSHLHVVVVVKEPIKTWGIQVRKLFYVEQLLAKSKIYHNFRQLYYCMKSLYEANVFLPYDTYTMDGYI